MLNTKDKKSYVEVLSFIELLDENQKNKIPIALKNFFEEEKDNNYEKVIYKNIPIKEQNLMKETLALIAFINLKYLCNDEEEKEKLIKIYNENEKEYQINLHEKYNQSNIFESKKDSFKNIRYDISTEISMIEYKQKNFIQKLLDKIKNLFKRN